MANYVPGKGSSTAKLMVVGEFPWADEDDKQAPFVGKTGALVRSMLSEMGYPESNAYYTYVFKYRPPNDDLKYISMTGHTVEEGMVQLWQEIEAIKPNCILALGDLALNKLTGHKKINAFRGSILTALNSAGTKVVASIHPGFIYRFGKGEYASLAWIRKDFSRAIEESVSPLLNLPARHIEIAKNSMDVYRFFEKYKGWKKAASDIETLKCILPTCTSFAFEPNHAISIPLLSPHTWARNSWEIPEQDMLEIIKMVARKYGEIEVIGQNWKFDQEKLDCFGLRTSLHADIGMMMHVAYPEFSKSLAFMTSVFTREPYYKDEGREFNPKKDNAEQHFRYNAKDSAVTIEIFNVLDQELEELGLREFFYNFVHHLHAFYRDMERAGINVDMKLRAELLKKYKAWEQDEIKKLHAIAGWPINPNSPKQVAIFLNRDLGLPIREGTDEDTLVALLGNHAKSDKAKDGICGILSTRRIRKAISTYITAEPDYDGRMRTSININGTETGRTSNSILDQPVRPEPIGLGFQTIPKHGDYGTEVGEYLIPDSKDHIFVQIDLSQAEARVVALLANDEYLLHLFATKQDVHRITASWICDKMPEKIVGEERFLGKTARHAGAYDERKRRFMLTVNTDIRKFRINMEPISEWRAGQILEKFHKKSPNIRGVFHAQVREAIEKTRELVTPYGRKRHFFGRMDDDIFREGYAYIPQSTVGDHVKMAGLRAKKYIPDIRFIAEKHDALIMHAPKSDAKDWAMCLKAELEKPIDFGICTLQRGQLVIPADVEFGENMKDFKKVAL